MKEILAWFKELFRKFRFKIICLFKLEFRLGDKEDETQSKEEIKHD